MTSTAKLARLFALAEDERLAPLDRDVIRWAAAELRYARAFKYLERAWQRLVGPGEGSVRKERSRSAAIGDLKTYLDEFHAAELARRP